MFLATIAAAALVQLCLLDNVDAPPGFWPYSASPP